MKTIVSKCAKEGITLEQSISTTVKKTWYFNPLKQRPLIYTKNTPNSRPTAALLPAAPVPNPIWFLTPIIYITQLPWVLLLHPVLLSQGAATAPLVLSPDPRAVSTAQLPHCCSLQHLLPSPASPASAQERSPKAPASACPNSILLWIISLKTRNKTALKKSLG